MINKCAYCYMPDIDGPLAMLNDKLCCFTCYRQAYYDQSQRVSTLLDTIRRLEKQVHDRYEEPVKQSRPICTTCNDTHGVETERSTIMCTHCPTPCRKCASVNGFGPYCATPHCDCNCHTTKNTPTICRDCKRFKGGPSYCYRGDEGGDVTGGSLACDEFRNKDDCCNCGHGHGAHRRSGKCRIENCNCVEYKTSHHHNKE